MDGDGDNVLLSHCSSFDMCIKTWAVKSILLFSLVKITECGSNDDDNADEGTIMKFTFAENSKYGPTKWTDNIVPKENKLGFKKVGGVALRRTLNSQKIAQLEKKIFEKNNCRSNWLSPIDINTEQVVAPELGKQADAIDAQSNSLPETLIITTNDLSSEGEPWDFGHPDENYNGIEIHPKNVGIMQLMDNFDPIGKTEPYVTYDFHFLTLYYCDITKAPKHRSMHQIDGERFPLELHFVFMKGHEGNPDWFERDNSAPMMASRNEKGDTPHQQASSLFIEGQNIAVIVVVLGTVGEENRYFKPVVEAAKKFHGKDFGIELLDDLNNVRIASPWSPSWLLPDASDYYYYDHGSFPVPPCWKVSRYYIMREKIQISQSQLEVLTNIKTDREKKSGGKLACTHSILQHEILTGEVTQNLVEFVFNGNDRKPRTEKETKELERRKKKMDTFRKRLKGVAVVDDDLDADCAPNRWNFMAITINALLSNWIALVWWKIN